MSNLEQFILGVVIMAYAIWSTWWNQKFMRAIESAASEIDALTKERDALKAELKLHQPQNPFADMTDAEIEAMPDRDFKKELGGG